MPRMGKISTAHAYIILASKSEINRSLGRPRRGCKDNIKTCVVETGLKGVDWFHLAQDVDCWRALKSL